MSRRHREAESCQQSAQGSSRSRGSSVRNQVNGMPYSARQTSSAQSLISGDGFAEAPSSSARSGASFNPCSRIAPGHSAPPPKGATKVLRDHRPMPPYATDAETYTSRPASAAPALPCQHESCPAEGPCKLAGHRMPSEKYSATAKPRRRGVKQCSAGLRTMADKVMFGKDDSEDALHSFSHWEGLAGLSSRQLLENIGREKTHQKIAPDMGNCADPPTPRRMKTNSNPRIYQSNIATMLGGSETPSAQSQMEATWESEPDRHGKRIANRSPRPIFKRPDQIQLRSAERVELARGPSAFDMHYASNLFDYERAAARNEVRKQDADKSLSDIYDGSAGRPSWQSLPPSGLRSLSEAPNANSVVETVVFGGDSDMERQTQRHVDMFQGSAGRPTCIQEQRTGPKHYDDHPSNHWSSANTDPWRALTARSSPRLQQPGLFSGHAGLGSFEDPKSVMHPGPRHILAPTIVDKMFCPGNADLEMPPEASAPPPEWVSPRTAGTKSTEKRANEYMEMRADNAEQFGGWCSNRPTWPKNRSSTPHQTRGASTFGATSGMSSKRGQDRFGLSMSKSGPLGGQRALPGGPSLPMGKTRSVSPRAPRSSARG